MFVSVWLWFVISCTYSVFLVVKLPFKGHWDLLKTKGLKNIECFNWFNECIQREHFENMQLIHPTLSPSCQSVENDSDSELAVLHNIHNLPRLKFHCPPEIQPPSQTSALHETRSLAFEAVRVPQFNCRTGLILLNNQDVEMSLPHSLMLSVHEFTQAPDIVAQTWKDPKMFSPNPTHGYTPRTQPGDTDLIGQHFELCFFWTTLLAIEHSHSKYKASTQSLEK